MKKLKKAGEYLLMVFLLLCLAAVRELPVQAGTSTDVTLRVAFYPLDGFFEYDEQGQETGYGVAILDMISKYTGIHFTYVEADSWESTKQMLLEDKADVRMPGTLPQTPSTTLDYTEHSVVDTYYAIMTLNSRSDLYYEDYDTIAELKIGISQNLYNTTEMETILSDLGVSLENLSFYDGYNECREALENGSIDALISNVMDLDGEMKQLERFLTVSNYISMRIGSPELVTINDALSQIKLNEPTVLSDLYKEWFPDRVKVPLTKEETEYVQSLDSLCFSFRDGQGYLARKEEDGHFVGFYPKVAQWICRELGVEYEEDELSNEKKEQLTIYPGFYYDHVWAEKNQTDITNPYFQISYYEMKRKNTILDKNTCSVAAVENYRVTQDYIKSGYREDQMVWCDDYASCIEAVDQGKADVTYVNSYAAEYYLAMYRYNGISSSLTDYSNQACFGVWNDETGLLSSILNKMITRMTSDELETLMLSCTSEKPEQNLFLEWLYVDPVRSMISASILVAACITLACLIFFMNRMRKKNIAL